MMHTCALNVQFGANQRDKLKTSALSMCQEAKIACFTHAKTVPSQSGHLNRKTLSKNDADLSLNQAKICKSQFRNGKINLS